MSSSGTTSPRGGHAVVLGASLAGLFAAGALARHVERVTVVERDPLPDGPEWRRGISQARHAHNLMTAGHVAMEHLFPGVRQALLDAGMVNVRMPEDMLLLTAGGWMPRFHTELAMLTGSRSVIDWVVRQQLAKNPRVTVVDQTQAVGLLPAGGGGAVRGVLLRGRDGDGWGEPYEVAADLVVDTTGRTSRAPQWLAELGYGTPAESTVDAQTAYATCVFEPPAGLEADWKCILLQYAPEAPRQGILNPIEGGRWMVSLAALGGQVPPTDIEGYLGYAKSLRHPILYEVLREATPVTPVHRSGRTENRRVHYEKLRRWPDRLVVMGDAAGAFNPSYGQGMSVAASSAMALDTMLAGARSLDGIGSRMRAKVKKRISIAWAIAATADLKYPWSADRVDLQTRVALAYLYRVIAASPTSEAASRALLDINQLVATPNAVFRPSVVAAVARGPRGRVATDPPPLPGHQAAAGARTSTTGHAMVD